MIQPSLLEYSKKALQEKLFFAKNNRELLQTTCNQNDKLYLHLDIVGKYFAQNRRVLMSNDFVMVINLILENEISNAVFTSHFMYHGEDFKLIWENLKHIIINLDEIRKRNIKFEFYIDQNYIDATDIFIKENELNEVIELGIWYDLEKWVDIEESKYKILLMTVLAGKSGQKITKETIYLANQKIDKLNGEIIFDGGIDFDNINDFNIRDGINFVSYSAVWKKLL